jgi:hypothetical protein
MADRLELLQQVKAERELMLRAIPKLCEAADSNEEALGRQIIVLLHQLAAELPEQHDDRVAEMAQYWAPVGKVGHAAMGHPFDEDQQLRAPSCHTLVWKFSHDVATRLHDSLLEGGWPHARKAILQLRCLPGEDLVSLIANEYQSAVHALGQLEETPQTTHPKESAWAKLKPCERQAQWAYERVVGQLRGQNYDEATFWRLIKELDGYTAPTSKATFDKYCDRAWTALKKDGLRRTPSKA